MSTSLLVESDNNVYKKNADGTYTQVAQHNVKPLGTGLIVGTLLLGLYGAWKLGKKSRK